MKTMKLILAAVLAVALSACSSAGTKPDPNYTAYLKAQTAAAKAHHPAIQIVSIEAQPGQQITMGGVAKFTVSMPAAPAAQVQQAQTQPSELVELARTVMPVVGAVGGIWAAGNAATNLAKAVGGVAQTPQANITDSHNVDSHAIDSHAVDSHAVDSHAITQPSASK